MSWQSALRLLLLLLLLLPTKPVIAGDGLLPADLVIELDRHERILAAEKDVAVATEARRTAYAGYLPNVSASLYQGTEKIKNADGSRTSTNIHEQGINVVQSLYDFGLTDAQVDIADLGIQRAKLALRFAQESLLMEGIAAYLGLEKSSGRVDYALQSEKNIKKQTGMEESLVEAGAGIPSDVLQTKAQLTGTQALRVQEEGMNRLAESRYWAVFGISPQERPEYSIPEPPLNRLPVSLDQALHMSDENSAEVEMGRIDIEIARATVRNQKANAQPKLSFNLDYKQNSGSAGDKTEGVAKVALSWPLYSGGSEQSAIESSIHARRAAELRLEDTRKRVHEAVRIAWYNWKTAKKTATLLKNQSNIAFEFLEQARIERKLGSRTLQDVLTGETTYLTAISNAVSAEIDYKIAAYQLLNAVGLLKQEGVSQPDSSVQEPQALEVSKEPVDVSEEPASMVQSVPQKAEPQPSDALSRAVDRVSAHIPSGIMNTPVVAESVQQEPISVSLVPEKVRREIDGKIHKSRSAYQSKVKRIQIEPVMEPMPVTNGEPEEMISITGPKKAVTYSSRSRPRKMILIGPDDRLQEPFRGIQLVGPGGVGGQLKLDQLEEQSEPQWIKLR